MIKLRKGGKVFTVLGLALATAAAGCATAEDSTDGLVARASKNGDARYIVTFNEGKGANGKKALEEAGASVELELEAQNSVAARIPGNKLYGLSHNPHIEFIEEDVIREPQSLWSNNTAGGETLPYGVQMVQGNLVNSPNIANRTVCIIDSGYSQQHVDLRPQGDGVSFTNTTGTGSWDNDSCGHGSHVAGTISAIPGNGTGVVGVAPGVKLHIVKVFGNDDLAGGSCSWTYSSNLIAAVNLCRAAGANVISMSLGGGARSRLEDRAFSDAYKAGVLSIAAAGNAGDTTTSYPAGYSSVMSVAAIDASEQLGSFSQRNRDVEISAPGVAVLSSVPWRESNSMSVGSTTFDGKHVEGAARTNGTNGAVVDGGQCTAAGAWGGKVVLCQRGTISFAQKVDFVKAGGGVAAVIYNNVASDATCGDFGGTLGDGVTSTIPAITVSCANGSSALGKVGQQGTVASSVSLPDSGYEAWDGTSMATPHVSAVAALIWSCNPGKTNAQIRDALDATARDLGARGKDNSFGYGVIQAKAALLSLGVGSCTVN